MTKLLYALLPERQDIFPVVYIVVLPLSGRFPLTVSIAHHRFTMRSAQTNCVLIGHFLIPFGKKERDGALMHGRPECIGPQTKQQFKNTCMRFRPYLSFPLGRLIMFPTPGSQSPVFIINKYSPISYLRIIQFPETCRQTKFLFFFGYRISPPFPWRNSHHTRKFKYSISRSTLITPCHDQSSIRKHIQ